MTTKAPGTLRSPRLMLVELNEFDPDYLTLMAQRMKLPNLSRALSLAHASTTTTDETEHHGLDPWVQWVGVHTGKPTSEHGIRRLGATRMQPWPQMWHKIAECGFSWGVWGAMNAPMGDAKGCGFFMPDPWSFDEVAYPSNLNDLLALPRYAAKNYLDMDYREVCLELTKLVRFFCHPRKAVMLPRFAAKFVHGVYTSGFNVHTFTTLLDYLSVVCFVQLRRDLRPDLSIIFLNHIAHLQHQFWTTPDPTPEMKFGLQLCEAMLGLLLASRDEQEAIVIMNGLKQKNVAEEGYFVYRQINPSSALQALAISGGSVEQCMTHDATILFSSPEEAAKAVELLERCRLSDGVKAFFVERQNRHRVFFQLAFDHRVGRDCRLICGDRDLAFYSVFQLVCERTGAHVPKGDIFFDGIEFPGTLPNHHVFDRVLSHFTNAMSGMPEEARALL